MKGFQRVTLPRFFFSITLLIFSLANTALANPTFSSPVTSAPAPTRGAGAQQLLNDAANTANYGVDAARPAAGVVTPRAPVVTAPNYQAPATNTYAAPAYSAPAAAATTQAGSANRAPQPEVNFDQSPVVRAPVTGAPVVSAPTFAAAPAASVDPIVTAPVVTRPVVPTTTSIPVSAAAATEILRAAVPSANLEPVVTDLANGGYSFQVQAGDNSHALQAKDTNTGDTITLVGEGTPANSDVSVTYGEITTTASVSGPIMCWRVRRGESSCGHGPFPPSKVVYKSARSVEIWEVCSDKSEKLLGSRIEGCISGQGFEFCPADGGPCRPAVPVTEPYPKDSPPDGLGVPTAGEAETPGAETPGTGGVTPPAKDPETGSGAAPTTEGPTAPTTGDPNPSGSNPSSPPAGTPAGNPPAANPPASEPDSPSAPEVCGPGGCSKAPGSTGGHETDPVGSDDGVGATPGGDPTAPAGSAAPSPGSTDGTKGKGKPAPGTGTGPVDRPKPPSSSSGPSAGTPSGGGARPPGGAPTGGGVGTDPVTPPTNSSPGAGNTPGGGPVSGPRPDPVSSSPEVMCPNGYTVIYTRNDCSACKKLKFKNGQSGQVSDAWMRYWYDPCVVIRDYDHIAATRPTEKAFADSIESGLPEFIHATPEQASSMGMTDSSGRGTNFGKPK